MNRKECLKAYENLCSALIETDYIECHQCYSYQTHEEELGVFYKLIEEHFDNPPLKFEELKEKTWYWHNPSKSWIYLFKPLNWEPEKGLRYAERIIDHSAEGCYMPFKTGTLFRKQVKE